MKKLLAFSPSRFFGLVLRALFFGLAVDVSANADPVRETRVPGDTNCDGKLDIGDAVYTLNYLFAGTVGAPCPLGDSPELLARVAQLEADVEATRSEIEDLKAESASTSSALATCQSDLQAADKRIQELEVPGCTDPTADNFSLQANVDDGTCKLSGCTDPNAINYDSKANVDDGSCRYPSDAPGRLHFYRIAALPPLTVHVPEGEGKGINNAGWVIGHSFYEVLWKPDGNIVPLPNPEGTFEKVYSANLNDAGVVVGFFQDVNGFNNFPFLWREDGATEVLPGGPGLAADINNQGVVVGELFPNAVRWEPDGRVRLLDNSPGRAFAINNNGQAVGYINESFPHIPFIWEDDGTVHQLPVPFPFTSGEAFDLNDKGIVVGRLGDFAIMWDTNHGDQVTELDPDPGSGRGSTAYRINNLGQVIILGGTRGPYLFGDGVILPIADLIENPDGWTGIQPQGINDAGVIAGTGYDGKHRAIVLTPTERFYAPR